VPGSVRFGSRTGFSRTTGLEIASSCVLVSIQTPPSSLLPTKLLSRASQGIKEENPNCGGALLTGPIQQLFDWIDGNGPAPGIEPRFASIDILESVAVVRLEVEHWSGKLAGSEARMSDVLTLLKTEEGWKISQKTFHWHSQ